MKIIIVGAGRNGCALIEALQGRNYDITVVDRKKTLVDSITDKYNVGGVVGSGASKETLLKAGADSADVLIALTPVDEVNLLSCMQAKALGTLRTGARVFQPDFAAERKDLKRDQGIDYIFNPKYDMAEAAARSIGLPGVVKPEGVFGKKLHMVAVTVTEDSPVVGKNLMQIRQKIGIDVIVGTVVRDGRLHVPDGRFEIQVKDRVGIAARQEDVFTVLKEFGIVRNPAKKVMIVGGDITAEYLIEMLLEERKSITVIESDLNRCRELMEKYPSIHVSLGQGEMSEILEDEGIGSMDALVSLTAVDETNLVTSMYGWSRNVPSILTKIDAPGHLKLLQRINLDITLSSAEVSINKLVLFVYNCEMGEASNDIEQYCTIADGMAEMLQFTADIGCAKLGIPFRDSGFKVRKNSIVVALIRGGELIIPNGGSSIKQGDKVLVVTDKKNRILHLNDIFG